MTLAPSFSWSSQDRLILRRPDPARPQGGIQPSLQSSDSGEAGSHLAGRDVADGGVVGARLHSGGAEVPSVQSIIGPECEAPGNPDRRVTEGDFRPVGTPVSYTHLT